MLYNINYYYALAELHSVGLRIQPGDCHTISGPPGLSIATVHGPPAIYEGGQGLGFGYKWLAGLVSRVRMAPGSVWQGKSPGFVLGRPNTAQWTVRGDRPQRDRTRL